MARWRKVSTGIYEIEFDKWESKFLRSVLCIHYGNQSKAAKYLGIGRTRLTRKLIYHGITKTEIQSYKNLPSY